MVPLQPFVYICSKLHEIEHGDAPITHESDTNSGVVNICDSQTQLSAIGPLNVFFGHSDLVQDMKNCLPDLQRFHTNLFRFMHDKYNNIIGKDTRDTCGARVDFGVGQIQHYPTSYMNKVDGLRHNLPHCNLSVLEEMDHELRNEIMLTLQYFDEKVNTCCNRKCCDPVRSQIVNQIFEDAGWGGPKMNWEYVNISIRSTKDTLKRHRDTKNDRRSGYDHAAVYSFLIPYDGDIFRVVIVMTFRTNMGSVVDRVHYLTEYKNHVLDAIIELNDRWGSTKRAIKNVVRTKVGNNDEWYDKVFNVAIETLHSEGVIVKVNKSSYKLYKSAHQHRKMAMVKKLPVNQRSKTAAYTRSGQSGRLR